MPVFEKVTRPIRAGPVRPSALDSMYMIRGSTTSASHPTNACPRWVPPIAGFVSFATDRDRQMECSAETGCWSPDRSVSIVSATCAAMPSPGAPGVREDGSKRRTVVARSPRGQRAARELDPTRGGVGVAGTGAALRVVGESAHAVVPTHPCRAVSARRRGARRRDPHRQDPGHARRPIVASVAGGAGASRRGIG